LKIFFTNNSGLLEADLIKLLENEHICIGIRGESLEWNRKEIIKMIEDEAPDIIIHCGEIKEERYCEDNPRTAFKVNSLLTRDIACISSRLGCKLVYISSFHVFSGKKGEAYYEFDRPDPTSIYGWSKWWGEHYVSTLKENYYIIRMPFLFGLSDEAGEGIINEFYLNFKYYNQAKSACFYSDLVVNPTWTFHAAVIIINLLFSGNYGIFHPANTGAIPLNHFVKSVLEEKGIKTSLPRVEPKKNYRYKVIQSAYLPYSSMVKDLPSWRDALQECMQQNIVTTRAEQDK